MKNRWNLILIIALVIGGFLSLFASSSPDGLEKVAEEHGFLTQGTSFDAGLMPNYAAPAISHSGLAGSLAGIAGTLMVFVALALLGQLLFRYKK